MEIDNKKIKRILVLRYRSIGDILLSYPTLETLRRTYPDARIDLVIDDVFRDICSSWTVIDHLVLNNRSKKEIGQLSKLWNEIKFVWKILRQRYNLVVDLHCGPRSATLSFLSLAKYRIGNKLRLRNRLLYNIFPEPTGDRLLHSVDGMLSLIAPLKPVALKKKSLYLSYNEKDRNYINSLLDRIGFGGEGGFALVHPGARVDFKMLPTSTLGKVVDYIISEFGIKVMLVGTDNEITYISEIAQASGQKCGVVTNLTLGQLVALTDRSKIFIGNDSGPMHIASALRKPVVAFFGPSDPKKWRPWSAGGKVVKAPPLDCMPCDQKRCPELPDHCMSKIKFDDIKPAVDSFLREGDSKVKES